MSLLAKSKRKAPAKQRSQEHHTSFHNSHKNPVNIHGIYSFCYNFVPEGQQALDEQPSFGGVQRQIDLVFLPHPQHLPSFPLESSQSISICSLDLRLVLLYSSEQSQSMR